jgi:hypothetical protein
VEGSGDRSMRHSATSPIAMLAIAHVPRQR